MNTPAVPLYSLFLFLLLHLINSLDTLGPNDTTKDGDVLTSRERKFALGFFSPGNSSLHYVGIRYYGPVEQTVIWAANRENPVNDTAGVLPFDHYGNLVIRENILDKRTGLNRFVTSWKSEDDPAPGNCSFRLEPTGYPLFFLYKDRAPYWWGGPTIERLDGGVHKKAYDFVFSNITTVNNATEVSIMCGVGNASVIVRIVVHASRSVKHFTWHDEDQQWSEFACYPKEQCDYYSKCGPNGNCGANNADQLDCTF